EYSAIRVALLDLGGARVRCGRGLLVLVVLLLRLGRRESHLSLPLLRGRAVTRLLLLGGLGCLLLRPQRLRRRRRGLRLGILRRAGLRLLARPQPLTLDHGVGDDTAHQVGGADGVVVAA